ncbi:MAG: MFS transporter [Bacteroidales bacterium]|nr:MFS transporter [Bacteroidales bacterium]MBK7626234.1 MFS transporter [Bacteroidales bacterium]
METVKKTQLFNASCVALVVTALAFATRGSFVEAWATEFNLTHVEVGWIVGTAFWGFTLAMVFGGPLVDIIGIGRIIAIAFFCHVAGIVLTIIATGFWSLFISTLLIGIANGSVEAACNPLITSMYTEEKTRRLNRFHAWFPTGIVIGGLAVYIFNKAGLADWRYAMGIMLLPTFAYGYMFLNKKFPQTERVVSGFSYKDMLKACVSPLFIFMALSMILTAGTELGTNQWIAALLANVSSNPILLLVWISGIMALARQFGGTLIHNMKSTVVLLTSSVLAFIGCILMGYTSGAMVFASAGIFALGVAFFWPSMLGFVSENIPQSGALGLAIMGGIGFLGGAIAQPVLGAIFDAQTLAAIPAGEAVETLKAAAAGTQEAATWAAAQLTGGSHTLRLVAFVPAVLIVSFTFLHIWKRKHV